MVPVVFLLALGAIPALAFAWGLFASGDTARRLRSADPSERLGALVELVMEFPELYPSFAPRIDAAIAARARA